MTDSNPLRRRFCIAALLVVLPFSFVPGFVLPTLAACTAEAEAARPLAVVVVEASAAGASGENAPGGTAPDGVAADGIAPNASAPADWVLRELAQSCQGRGWATVIAGRYAAPGLTVPGFAAHCVFGSEGTREWGPVVLRDGERVTLPDDVRAGAVFTEYLVARARDVGRRRPALLCYRPLEATLDRAGLEGIVRGLAAAFERDRGSHRTVVVLGVDGRPAAALSQRAGLPCLVAGVAGGRVAVVRRRLATIGQIRALVREAVRLHGQRSGRSLIEQFGQAELPVDERAR